MLTFIAILVSACILSLTSLYIAYPFRKVYTNSNFEYYYSELVNRVENLIKEYSVPRFDYDDLVEERRITTVEYNEMVKKTYTFVMGLIPSYILNNLYLYISEDEVQNLVLYRINREFQSHYGGFVREPDELLDENDTRSITDQSFDVNGNVI